MSVVNSATEVPDALVGERILPAYNRLARAVREWRWFGGEGMRVAQLPNGVQVIRVPESNPWNHPWRVRVGGGKVQVSPGRVNGELPVLDGRPMDGLDKDGEPDERGVPVLDVGKRKKFPAWVVLRVRVDGDWRLLPKSEITDSDEVSWGAGWSRAVARDGAMCGDFPLALLRKSKDGEATAVQFAHFNLRCRPQRLPSGVGRFWFFV